MLSHLVVSDSLWLPWTVACQAPLSMGILRARINGEGCHALLQGIFPTQGSNPGLPHYRQILYCLRHQGNPRKLEWVAYPFSRGSSRPRNQTGTSSTAGGFSPSWSTREVPLLVKEIQIQTTMRYYCILYIHGWLMSMYDKNH